ncbi:MAG: PHB depolymerase family esterase [Elusimicrobiota bacterium]|nr:PHB depolymerase family esterase [Elusimicrobiota bacterium]
MSRVLQLAKSRSGRAPVKFMGVVLLILAASLGRPARAGEGAGSLKQFKIEAGGYTRAYRVYSPQNLEKTKKYPLLVILHGGGGTGKGMPRLTRGGFEALADANGAILAYPDGLDKNWNDYRADKSRKAQRENIDDVAFITAMLDAIAGTYPVDAGRVYAAGISNGAMMSYTLACRAAERFAAIAPVAGAMPENLAPACSPSRPVPALIISGTEDRLVHWEGGYVTGPFGRKKLGRTIPVEKSRDFWLEKNSCDAARKEISKTDSDPGDGMAVEREVYSACAGGSAVEFIKIAGGGHTWPGGLQYLPERIIGKTSREINATAEIWNFFMKHSLPPRP